MSRLLLYSVSSNEARKNFDKTIKNSVEISDFRQWISEDEEKRIQDCFVESNCKIFLWGCKGTEYYDRKIKHVNKGDQIAFSFNKQFIRTGEVVCILKNTNISRLCWGTELFNYIIIIKDMINISLPYSIFFKDIRYNDKAKVNGLVIVDNSRLSDLLKNSGTINDYFAKYLVHQNLG